MGYIYFIEIEGAFILVGDVIFSADWHESLRTVGYQGLSVGSLGYYLSFSARPLMEHFNIGCSDCALVFVGYVINTADLGVTPRTG